MDSVELRLTMKRVRKHYELSKISISRVCGFGDNQWMMYENGSAEPNKSNLNLIKLTFCPSSMHSLLKYADPADIHMLERAREISEQTMRDIKSSVKKFQKELEQNYHK